MKIKLFVALFSILSYGNFLYSQRDSSEIDSILNIYERQYRTTLNESDFVLIDKQLEEVGSNCQRLQEIMNSKLYSTNYKIALLGNFKSWNLCLEISLEYIAMSKVPEDDTLLPWDYKREYPIFNKIVKDQKIMKHFYNYLMESEYLSSCDFLLKNRSSETIEMLSFIVNSNSKDKYFIDNNSCKMANLTILKGINSKLVEEIKENHD